MVCHFEVSFAGAEVVVMVADFMAKRNDFFYDIFVSGFVSYSYVIGTFYSHFMLHAGKPECVFIF